MGIDENKDRIMFCECKWQDKADAGKLIEELKEKVKYVDWKNEKRKESYAVFAKSFKRKIKDENVHCLDLKDLERLFRKKR